MGDPGDDALLELTEFNRLVTAFREYPGDLFVSRLLRDYGSCENRLENTRSLLFETLRESDDFPYGQHVELKRRMYNRKGGDTVAVKLANDIKTLLAVTEGDDISLLKDMISSSSRKSSSHPTSVVNQNQSQATASAAILPCSCAQDVVILKDTVTTLQAEILMLKQCMAANENLRCQQIQVVNHSVLGMKADLKSCSVTINDSVKSLSKSIIGHSQYLCMNIRTRLYWQTHSAVMATTVETGSRLGRSNQHCCVPGCNGDGRYHQDLHFHRIPKDKDQKKKWIVKIRRDTGENFQITNSTVVCSRHFKKQDYRSWGPVKKNLKKDAVPTVFLWTGAKGDERKKNRKMLANEANGNNSLDYDSGDEEEMDVEVGDGQSCSVTEEEDSKKKIADLEDQLSDKTEQCASLKKKLELERFGLNRFSNDDAMINFYTGFSTYYAFLTFFQCIQPSASNMQSAYYQPSNTTSLAGRKRNMLLIDEMFMFFSRLRAGLFEQDLSVRFNVSVATVSRKIVTWANFLYVVLGSIPIWLSRDVIQHHMPECFKNVYPRTRVIIDCTELKTQQPSSLVFNSQSYSSYKSANTFKCLLGIAPHGAVSFISPLYTGSMSDVEITRLSGLLDLLEEGDDVMADKGFTLRKELAEKGITLNIPHFLSCKKQVTIDEIEETEQIAKLRIHIERMNRRIKENHLFDNPIPICLSGTVNQLWTVACLLANFKGPLVNAWSSQ